jgi:hypothetical protein
MEQFMILRDWINIDKIDWFLLSKNPSIFTYDYTKLKQSRLSLHKDLIEYIWHPLTIQKWIEQYCILNDDEDDGYEVYEKIYT